MRALSGGSLRRIDDIRSMVETVNIYYNYIDSAIGWYYSKILTFILILIVEYSTLYATDTSLAKQCMIQWFLIIINLNTILSQHTTLPQCKL